jgi:hypothetical protein
VRRGGGARGGSEEGGGCGHTHVASSAAANKAPDRLRRWRHMVAAAAEYRSVGRMQGGRGSTGQTQKPTVDAGPLGLRLLLRVARQRGEAAEVELRVLALEGAGAAEHEALALGGVV